MDSNNTSEPVNLFPDLEIDGYVVAQLKEISSWTKFLSIVGFVFCGITLMLAMLEILLTSNIGGLFSSILGNGFMAFVIYVTVAFLIFFPALNLFRFSNKAKSALANGNQEDINYAFSQLKSYFRFVGILTLVLIGFYGTLVGAAIFVALTDVKHVL